MVEVLDHLILAALDGGGSDKLIDAGSPHSAEITIGKPFTPTQLARAARRALERRPEPGANGDTKPHGGAKPSAGKASSR